MNIRWSSRSILDWNSILDYQADKNSSDAVDLNLRIETAVEALLPDHPNAGKAGHGQGTREYVVPNTSYVVV